MLGDVKGCCELEVQAEALRTQFEEQFWCDDLGTYALALDGRKKPCRVRASNAGHCLYTGIASPERARRVVETLMNIDSFTGWGIRTVATTESRYNPLSYHNGSIWPHDNSIIANGMAKYGSKKMAGQVLLALLDLSSEVELRRLPELFCGLKRRPDRRTYSLSGRLLTPSLGRCSAFSNPRRMPRNRGTGRSRTHPLRSAFSA